MAASYSLFITVACLCLISVVSNHHLIKTHPNERYSLKKLYEATMGPRWKRTWPVNDPLSDPCFDMWPGLSCDADGHILRINLKNNGLWGRLTPFLGRFTRLEELDISYNTLTHQLPDSIVDLKTLKSLKFSHNRLSGQLPDGWCTWQELEVLEFNNNEFQGPMPACIREFPRKIGTKLRYHDYAYPPVDENDLEEL